MGEERTGLLDNGFPLDEDDETALLEASTGFSVLDEEDEDVSEMLRVLERQESTLQVQLDNLWDSLTELEEQEGRQGEDGDVGPHAAALLPEGAVPAAGGGGKVEDPDIPQAAEQLLGAPGGVAPGLGGQAEDFLQDGSLLKRG